VAGNWKGFQTTGNIKYQIEIFDESARLVSGWFKANYERFTKQIFSKSSDRKSIVERRGYLNA
jgi:hypothetical protein